MSWSLFESFQTEIASHTQEEEKQVFPAIRRLESANEDQAAVAASLQSAFAELESEHQNAEAARSGLPN